MPTQLAPTAHASPRPLGPTATSRSAGTILLVEDEEPVRRVLTRLLSAHGFEVISAENAHDAQPLWRENLSRIDVLLTDVLLPGGVSGCDLARTLRKDNAQLSVIFTSGYNTDSTELSTAVGARTHFIPKPYPATDLLQLLRATVQSRAANI